MSWINLLIENGGLTAILMLLAVMYLERRITGVSDKLRGEIVQQSDKLRDEIALQRNETAQQLDKMRDEIALQRDETTQQLDKLRDETAQQLDKMRDETAQHLSRLRDKMDNDHRELQHSISAVKDSVAELTGRVARLEGLIRLPAAEPVAPAQ